MKTILVPTDFSIHSVHGLEFAAKIAKKNKSKLHLYNVAQTTNYYYPGDSIGIAPPAAIMTEGINENLKSAALSRLGQLSKRKFLKGLDVTTGCDAAANIHYTIIEYAEDIGADLIVMGSKGSSDIKSILLGSTAERVVRFSPRPVVVIPGKFMKPVPEIFVFASDFNEEAYDIFPVVRKFAKIFRAEIRLLKVNTMDQFNRTGDNMERMKKFSRKFGGNYEFAVYDDYMKEEGILNFARDSKADLIAIGTHGKKGLRRFFSEDVSEGIVRLSTIPIMIVNLKKFKSKSDLLTK